MCSTLRNTLRRGRSVVPVMRLRCRSWIRRRRSSFVLIFMFTPSRLFHRALGAVPLGGAVELPDSDALGNGDRLLSNSRHFFSPLGATPAPPRPGRRRSASQIFHTPSPPTPALTASRPVMTPREVV